MAKEKIFTLEQKKVLNLVSKEDYLTRKFYFTAVSNEEIQKVENLLNTRPRKRLGWLTPLEAFSKELNQFNIILKMPSVALTG